MSSSFTEDNQIDVEEELERFTLLRICNPQGIVNPTVNPYNDIESRNYKTENDVIPLLVKDIHLLELRDKSFAKTITAYGLSFQSAIIYGRICSIGAGANGKLRYCVDDGTGTIQVRLVKRNSKKEISKLGLECFRAFGHNAQLYSVVQSILNTARRQLLEIGSLPFGTKALLIGRPHLSYEEAIFSAFEIVIDDCSNTDIEMSVKKLMVDWYTKRYRGYKLEDPPAHLSS